VKDAFYTITNAEQAIELRAWQYTPMIGSSATVFGVVGAHVYVALLSRGHPAQMDSKAQLMWLGKVGMELARTPFSLDAISLLNNEDNIDHASHLCGFIGGLLLAAVWDSFSHQKRRHIII
jgi:membrane associated rhomboid family serine protease